MPLSINQIPTPVPSSTDPANFSARGDAVFGAFPNFITQTNAVASEAAANRDSAEASKTAAANSETNAATYAANATTSANNASSSSVAPLWVSGTTYAINDKRVSPITGQVYRRKTAGAGTTDPSLDSTNWYAVLLDADTQYPSIKPTLNLDFANSGKLDPRITFTRASTATYYDGKTFAKAEENLLKHSQSFLTTSWKFTGAIAAAPTISASGSTAPDGTTGSVASVSFPVVSSGWSFVYQESAASLVGLPVTASIWVRVPTGTASIFLNIEDSLESPTAPGTAIVGSAVSVTTTWQRISLSGTRTAGSGFAALIIGFDGRANAGQTNPSAFTLEIWGAQLEQRSSATAYTPTTSQPITKYQPVLKTASNNEPRFDYDPVTLEAKGLLIEESRTNLLTYSAQFDNAAWLKIGTTVTANAAVAPDGTVTADHITFSGAVNDRLDYATSIAAVAGATYTYSVWLKGAGFVIITLNTTSGVGGAVDKVITLTGDWVRHSVSVTYGADVTGNVRVHGVIDRAGSSPTVYAWGAQLEAGAFPTSYIPTTSSAVTRQADSASMTGTNFSSWYRQDEGSLCAEYFPSAASSGAVASLDMTGSISVILYDGLRSLTQYAYIGTAFGSLGNALPGVSAKAAIGFNLSSASASLNGATTVNITTTVPILVPNRLGIGSETSGSNIMNGHIKRITYYPKRLPNYQLQILTK